MNELITQIESVLVSNLRPHFLIISKEEDYINIIIARSEYKYLSIPNRVSRIYNLIEALIPDTIPKNKIIIQAFDCDEMSDYLEYLF